MNFFYIINGKRLKNYTVIILTAFVTAWFLYIQNIPFTVFSTNDGPKAVYKGKNGVALTFNITWGTTKAEPIVDLLVKENIKSATFFVSGSWAENHPHIVEKISKSGFEIGLLGYEYLDYSKIEDAKIRQDILRAEEILRKLNIKHKKILRAPNGHFDKRLLTIADRLGYSVVHWSIDTKDWQNPGIDQIVNSIKGAKNGDIILMSASDSAKQTAVALPEIIKTLEKKNLKFSTISEIMIDGKANTNEIN